MLRGIASLALCLLVVSTTSPSIAENISTSEITIVNLDATLSSNSGETKLNSVYENISLQFFPISSEPRMVDTNGVFTLAGPGPGLIASDCARVKGGRIFYPSQGSHSDSYRCGASSIRTEGTLSKNGHLWTFRGRLTGVEKNRRREGHTTWDQTQDIVLKIVGKSCEVVKFAIITRTEEKSEYARMIDKGPYISRAVHKPSSVCAFM